MYLFIYLPIHPSSLLYIFLFIYSCAFLQIRVQSGFSRNVKLRPIFYLSLCTYLSGSLSRDFYVYPCFFISIHQSLYLSIYQPPFLQIHKSRNVKLGSNPLYLCIYFSFHRSTCLSLFPYICLFIHPSIQLPSPKYEFDAFSVSRKAELRLVSSDVVFIVGLKMTSRAAPQSL